MATIGLVNVNTSPEMTDTVVKAARAVAAPDTDIVGITPEIGPASVETHLEGALSAVGVATAVLHYTKNSGNQPVDAWILCGYGDQGREALQELVDVPVVDITEAAAYTAMSIGDEFAVVTTLNRTTAMIRDRLRLAGVLDRVESIHGTGLGVLELENDSEATDSAILQKSQEALDRGADVICLGCAGMAGRGPELTKELGAPVVDGVTAAVGIAESLIRQGLSTSRVGTFAPRAPKPLAGFEHFEVH